MKFVVILGDGMSDYPIEELQGKTPLQAASTPTFDRLARTGEIGTAAMIPEGMPPGSDTANLAVMGYDPRRYYTGRSPFEAASMGVPLGDTDVTFRCNLVTLSTDEPYAEKVMLDHSSDEITSEEAHALIEAADARLHTDVLKFYPGVSYRHLLVWKDAPEGFLLTPPHDILGKKVTEYLPKGPHGATILRLMEESDTFLPDHPVNRARVARGLKPGNSLWIWGEGKKPQLTLFRDKYGLSGSVISAVDLIKGIGVCAGMRSVDVPGATGTIRSNFAGKADAAVAELMSGQDFVYVHMEAPDESGHRQEIENKVRSIEAVDDVTRRIIEGLEAAGEPYRILVLPDHPTPLRLRTHTAEPVPFLLYDSTRQRQPAARTYDEPTAQASGLFIAEGYTLMDRFLGRA